MQLHIGNEYDRLEAVLVHRPGAEIDRLTHENMKQFLFEDIPYLARIQEEHDAFVETMVGHGIRVFYLEHLLADLLAGEGAIRKRIVEEVCAAENARPIADDLLNASIVSPDDLLRFLFAGITFDEFSELTGKRMDAGSPQQSFILRPIPNAYFSRDPAVVVRDSAISCKMHHVERIRETVLTRAVLEHHPEFEGNDITYGGSESPEEDRPFTIEGGDVIVLNEQAVLVGASERTRSETIEVLAAKAFQVGHVERFYEIPIPVERTFMHLDTVFTIVDRGAVVWYPPVMDHIRHIHRYDSGPDGTVLRVPETRDLVQILSDEFGEAVRITRTGGGDAHYARREQRTDGTNIFAIAPRLAITYERNERTTAALEKAGIQCIAIRDSELVRGLGGPRCMTMPLRRSVKR